MIWKECKNIDSLKDFYKKSAYMSFSDFTTKRSKISNPHTLACFDNNKNIIAATVFSSFSKSILVHHWTIFASAIGSLPISSIFKSLKKWCKKNKIRAIIYSPFKDTNFININLDLLRTQLLTFKRIAMNLSFEDYMQIILEKNIQLSPGSIDFLEFDQEIFLKKLPRKKFYAKSIPSIAKEEFVNLQNKTYSAVKFDDNVKMLSKLSMEYNETMINNLFSGFYDAIDHKTSFAVLNNTKKLVAYVLCLQKKRDKGFVIDLNVDPDYQGFGIGSLLLKNVIVKYFEQGNCRSISLAVTLSNTKAINLYGFYGFQKIDQGEEGLLLI